MTQAKPRLSSKPCQPPLVLCVQGHPGEGQRDSERHEIHDDRCLVGSGDRSGSFGQSCLVLEFPGVASRHCEFVRSPAGTWVRREEGTVGIDGQNADEAWVFPGNRVALGEVELLVESDAPNQIDDCLAGDWSPAKIEKPCQPESPRACALAAEPMETAAAHPRECESSRMPVEVAGDVAAKQWAVEMPAAKVCEQHRNESENELVAQSCCEPADDFAGEQWTDVKDPEPAAKSVAEDEPMSCEESAPWDDQCDASCDQQAVADAADADASEEVAEGWMQADEANSPAGTPQWINQPDRDREQSSWLEELYDSVLSKAGDAKAAGAPDESEIDSGEDRECDATGENPGSSWLDGGKISVSELMKTGSEPTHARRQTGDHDQAAKVFERFETKASTNPETELESAVEHSEEPADFHSGSDWIEQDPAIGLSDFSDNSFETNQPSDEPHASFDNTPMADASAAIDSEFDEKQYAWSSWEASSSDESPVELSGPQSVQMDADWQSEDAVQASDIEPPMAARTSESLSLSELLESLNREFDSEPQEKATDESDFAGSFVADSEPAGEAPECDEESATNVDDMSMEESTSEPRSGSESVADLLARMQQSGELSFDTQDETPEAPTPSAAAPIQAPVANGGDDIEDYMLQLMNRLRGGSPAAEPAPVPVVEAAPVAKPARPRSDDLVPDNPLSASEYVPKGVAPEKSSTVSALRQIANQAVQSAIQKSTRKKNRDNSLLLLGGTGVSFFVSALLFMMSNTWFDLPFVLACLCAIGCAGCGYLFFRANMNSSETESTTDTDHEATAQKTATGSKS